MNTPRTSQKGATLIIALLVLLMMTLVSTAAMRGTIMQERMAGNVRDSNDAFQVAERLLRDMEESVREKVAGGGTGGLELPSLRDVQAAMGGDCSGTWLLVDRGFTGWVERADPSGFHGAAAIPRASPCIPPESLERGAGGAEYYWVSSEGIGLSGASRVILQTVYMTR